MNSKELTYSKLYSDNQYEYIHVILSTQLYEKITPFQILKEQEWKELGLTLSGDWEHYSFYKPEPHILLFRRSILMKQESDNESVKED